MVTHAGSVLVDSEREWVEWENLDVDEKDFPDCGAAFEREHPRAFETGWIGVGDAKLVAQRELVDFGMGCFETNRK